MQHVPLKSRVQTQKRRESWFYFIMQNEAQNMSSHGSRNGWSYSLTTCASIASFSSHVSSHWLKLLAHSLCLYLQVSPATCSPRGSSHWLKLLVDSSCLYLQVSPTRGSSHSLKLLAHSSCLHLPVSRALWWRHVCFVLNITSLAYC